LIVAVISISLILLASLNVVATVRLVRSDVYSAKQRVAQYIVIWAMPLVGAIVVISVLSPPREPERNRPDDMSPVRDDLWLVARSDGGSDVHSTSTTSTHSDS
jgi:hypothetical protein